MITKRKKSHDIPDGLLQELSPVSGYLSTGCTLLDLGISGRLPGGFPAGRMSHLWGTESSSKSIIVAEAIGSAQRQGGFGSLLDAESTFDMVRAHDLFGVNTEELEYYSPMGVGAEDGFTIERLFDGILPRLIKSAKSTEAPCCLGVDSLSALPSGVEVDEDVSKTGYGTSRPTVLSKAFRKYIWGLSQAGLSVVFVDQARDKIGGFVAGKTFSGGNALRFYASVRVYLDKVRNVVNKHKQIIGVDIRFKVDKNKVAPPFAEGEFRVIFDYGIDDVATNLMFIKSIEAKSATWFRVPGASSKFNSLSAAVHAVEKDGLEPKLWQEVAKLWQKIHAPEDRGERRRLL